MIGFFSVNADARAWVRTDLCEIEIVKGSEFVRKLQRVAAAAVFASSMIAASERVATGAFGSILNRQR